MGREKLNEQICSLFSDEFAFFRSKGNLLPATRSLSTPEEKQEAAEVIMEMFKTRTIPDNEREREEECMRHELAHALADPKEGRFGIFYREQKGRMMYITEGPRSDEEQIAIAAAPEDLSKADLKVIREARERMAGRGEG